MAPQTERKQRPKNLDLTTIRLPLPGILSILHRVSGAGLFLLLPVLLWLFQQGLASPESFAQLKGLVAYPLVRLFLLGVLWAYLHHFCAGIRYLLLDCHIGLELASARLSSQIVFGVSLGLTALIGWRVLA